MSDLEDIVAARVDDAPISLASVLRHAKRKNGLGFVQRAVDWFLIQRAIEREGICVSDAEVDALLAKVQPARGASTLETREDVKKTIAFGKLKGRVTALEGQVSSELHAKLGRESRSALRDLLFLVWLERERQVSRIDICLYRTIG